MITDEQATPGMILRCDLIPGGIKVVAHTLGTQDLAITAAQFRDHVARVVEALTDERTFVASRATTLVAEIHLARPHTRQDLLDAMPPDAREAQIAVWQAEAADWSGWHDWGQTA
jgi:hypothetical protein